MGGRAPQTGAPQQDETTDRGAERRPEGVYGPNYRDLAPRLLEMGYEPLPIRHASKAVADEAWTTLRIDTAQVEAWCRSHGNCGVGLRTGYLVGVDIDIQDADLAHQVGEIVQARLGTTLLRVGLWPKRLLAYRTHMPFPKMKLPGVEVLGDGQQFVAFGIHPVTRLGYHWPLGESVLDVPFDRLPQVDQAAIDAVLAEVSGLLPHPGGQTKGGTNGPIPTPLDPVRNADGLVVDGRDSWLSILAFHAVHDAIAMGGVLDEAQIAAFAWSRFEGSSDLSRPKSAGRCGYEYRDALSKVQDKLRLHRTHRLPSRPVVTAVPDYLPPIDSVADARSRLGDILGRYLDEVDAFASGDDTVTAPRLAIRATVGLGKSTAARQMVTERLPHWRKAGLPHRVLTFTPSLALADETAAGWQDLGMEAVVLRGYEARHPTGQPMCRDIDAVRAAIAARVDIQSSVCEASSRQCPFFTTCLKQQNRRDVAAAEVVIAAHDTMFTGFAGYMASFGLVVIDEAFWQRAWTETAGLTIEALPHLGIGALSSSHRRDKRGADNADVIATRDRLARAMHANGAGPMRCDSLAAETIDLPFCTQARDAEWRAMPMLNLVPGQPAADRRIAVSRAFEMGLRKSVIDLWEGVIDLLGQRQGAAGCLVLGDYDARTGQRPIRMYGRKSIASDIAMRPILHLDATLRRELVEPFLSEMRFEQVDAAAPYQHLRLIAGRFGKGNLCADPRAAVEENRRRDNRLREVVDYVRWHALRHAGERCLVVTYKDCEVAFAGIPGVTTAHFNAIAGLDAFGDISALFVIGRTLPQSDHLAGPCAALFGHVPAGGYAKASPGLWLKEGRKAAITTLRHADAAAEVLRAAICDDEVQQAVGRGRGINRGRENSLEVHLLADVVLRVEHASMQAWPAVQPDLVQGMLLSGLAVDSPSHAAALHPGLFANAGQAKKAFARAGFGGQTPIDISYREMSLKSAQYRLCGRGRGWQRAWWIVGTADDARARLEAAIGPLSEWAK